MRTVIETIETDKLGLLDTGMIFTGNCSTEIFLRYPLFMREKIKELIEKEAEICHITSVSLDLSAPGIHESFILVREGNVSSGLHFPHSYLYRFYLGSSCSFGARAKTPVIIRGHMNIFSITDFLQIDDIIFHRSKTTVLEFTYDCMATRKDEMFIIVDSKQYG